MNCFHRIIVTILLPAPLAVSSYATDLSTSQSRKAAFFRALTSQDAHYNPNEKINFNNIQKAAVAVALNITQTVPGVTSTQTQSTKKNLT